MQFRRDCRRDKIGIMMHHKCYILCSCPYTFVWHMMKELCACILLCRIIVAVDFTSEPFTVTIPASEDNCVITYQLPNNFTIDDNVNEMEQNFALIGELGDDVRDGFAFFQRRIGEEQGCVAGKTGATVIQITDNDR